MSDSTDEIMRRFESRIQSRPPKPPRKDEPLVIHPRIYAPADERARGVLRGAARVASRMMEDYPKDSNEVMALAVLSTFTLDMLGEGKSGR